MSYRTLRRTTSSMPSRHSQRLFPRSRSEKQRPTYAGRCPATAILHPRRQILPCRRRAATQTAPRRMHQRNRMALPSSHERPAGRPGTSGGSVRVSAARIWGRWNVLGGGLGGGGRVGRQAREAGVAPRAVLSGRRASSALPLGTDRGRRSAAPKGAGREVAHGPGACAPGLRPRGPKLRLTLREPADATEAADPSLEAPPPPPRSGRMRREWHRDSRRTEARKTRRKPEPCRRGSRVPPPHRSQCRIQASRYRSPLRCHALTCSGSGQRPPDGGPREPGRQTEGLRAEAAGGEPDGWGRGSGDALAAATESPAHLPARREGGGGTEGES